MTPHFRMGIDLADGSGDFSTVTLIHVDADGTATIAYRKQTQASRAQIELGLAEVLDRLCAASPVPVVLCRESP